MGDVSSRSVGDAFEGVSRFVSDDNRASLEEALEAAAREAAGSVEGSEEKSTGAGTSEQDAYQTSYDVHIEIKVRPHNQHVREYRVRITPGG